MATSKKFELKLTQVARASLEELKLDYEDFLRQKGMELWERDNPYRQKLVDARCKTSDEVARWIVDNSGHYGLGGQSGRTPTTSMLSTKVYPEMAANAALILITVACSLLNRQVQRLANDFEQEGGFTERMYKVRTVNRKQ